MVFQNTDSDIRDFYVFFNRYPKFSPYLKEDTVFAKPIIIFQGVPSSMY